MPKIVEVEKKRAEILAAAAATFARYGYRSTNLQRVAAKAGMGKSSLYHYFPNKEALFDALAERLLRQEADAFETLAAGAGTPHERLASLLDVIMNLLDAWVQAGPLLVDFLREPRGRRRVRDTFRTARRALTRLLRDGQRAGVFRAGRPAALAAVVLGSMDGMFLQEIIEPGSTGGRAAAVALRAMVLAALRPEEER